jgi:hypothetical protein
MKIVDFKAIQTEFVPQNVRTMTLNDAMQRISDNIIAAVENGGKGLKRSGKIFSYNENKSKLYLRIKYGSQEAFCLEGNAKNLEEAKAQAEKYAIAIKAGNIAPNEKELIEKAFKARLKKMDEARQIRKSKKIQ